jgi:hypothetical protein
MVKTTRCSSLKITFQFISMECLLELRSNWLLCKIEKLLINEIHLPH